MGLLQEARQRLGFLVADTRQYSDVVVVPDWINSVRNETVLWWLYLAQERATERELDCIQQSFELGRQQMRDLPYNGRGDKHNTVMVKMRMGGIFGGIYETGYKPENTRSSLAQTLAAKLDYLEIRISTGGKMVPRNKLTPKLRGYVVQRIDNIDPDTFDHLCLRAEIAGALAEYDSVHDDLVVRTRLEKILQKDLFPPISER